MTLAEYTASGVFPPNDKPEKALLASVLIDPERVTALEGLEPDDFYAARHRAIFSAVQRLHAKGRPANQVTVLGDMHDHGDHDDTSNAYVGLMVQDMPTSVYAEHYAAMVAKAGAQRRLMEVLSNSLHTVYDPKLEPHEAAEKVADKLIAAAPTPAGSKRRLKWKAAVDLLLEESSSPKGRRFQTGFKYVDQALGGGFERNSLAILAAETGQGKSTLAMQWIIHFEAQGQRCAVASFEMSEGQLVRRIIAAEARVPVDRVDDVMRDGTPELDAIMEATGIDRRIVMTSQPMDIDGIEGWARREHRQNGLDALLIDHLQLIPHKQDSARHLQLDDAAVRLKALALALNIVVIAVSQVNRQTDGKRLTISNVRDSGAIPANADAVLFLNEVDQKDKTDPRRKVVLHFGKNRFGSVQAEQALEFEAQLARFKPWA